MIHIDGKPVGAMASLGHRVREGDPVNGGSALTGRLSNTFGERHLLPGYGEAERSNPKHGRSFGR